MSPSQALRIALTNLRQGLDATYELFSRMYGTQGLNYLMNVIEYAPHRNPERDPFAAVFNVRFLFLGPWDKRANR